MIIIRRAREGHLIISNELIIDESYHIFDRFIVGWGDSKLQIRLENINFINKGYFA
jgi:hypothetical protein